MKFNHGKYILLIFLLSFSLRTIYMLVPEFNYNSKTIPVNFNARTQISDDRTYVVLAYGILKKGYPYKSGSFSMYAGFLYPYIVSVNLLFSNNLIYLFFFQIILDSLTAVLIFITALKVFGNFKTAVISGFLYALYYPSFVYTSRILSESVFTFLLILSLYAALRGLREKNLKYIFLFSGLLSVCALMKAMMLYLFVILFVYIIYLAFKRKLFAKSIVFSALIFVLIQTPYYFTSYATTGKIVVGSTNGWLMILNGTYLPTLGNELKDRDFFYYRDHPVGKMYILEDDLNMTEFQMDSAFKSLAKEQLARNIQTEPLKSAYVMLLQVSRFWLHMPYFIRFNPGFGTIINTAVNSVLLLFMLLAFYLKAIKEKDLFAVMCMIIIFSYTALHSIVFASIRYSAPLMPVVIIFSVYGIYYTYFKLIIKKENGLPGKT
ncbi:MAG: glycosyltransferase family 39 protein [Ignavibacteria bacterium]|nr:glycosyltransferase family 39 protein [Ignavibacteria bacterium]